MHGERIVMYTEVEMYTRSQCFKPMLSQLKKNYKTEEICHRSDGKNATGKVSW